MLRSSDPSQFDAAASSGSGAGGGAATGQHYNGSPMYMSTSTAAGGTSTTASYDTAIATAVSEAPSALPVVKTVPAGIAQPSHVQPAASSATAMSAEPESAAGFDSGKAIFQGGPAAEHTRVPSGGWNSSSTLLGNQAAMPQQKLQLQQHDGGPAMGESRTTTSSSHTVIPAPMIQPAHPAAAATNLTGALLAARLGRRLIMLAMDDSVASQVALNWTLNQMIHPERDHLVVVTVCAFKTATALLGTTKEEKTSRREIKAETRGQRICDFAAAHIAEWIKKMGVPISHEIVSLKAADDDARDVLVDYARDLHANMLILGSHAGQSTVKRYFSEILIARCGPHAHYRAILGSTSAYCLQHASVPVIVVREDGAVHAG